MSTDARRWWRGAMLAAFVLAVGCDNSWRTDMWYQPAVQPEQAPRPEPEHAVPLGEAEHFEDRDDAESLRNPVPADERSLRHGRLLFAQRCAACHGAAGHGGGPVSRLFPPATDLAYHTVRTRSDGYLYGTVTFGGRAMPPQGDGLTPRDRWDLVNVIRAIQRATPEAASPATPASSP